MSRLSVQIALALVALPCVNLHSAGSPRGPGAPCRYGRASGPSSLQYHWLLRPAAVACFVQAIAGELRDVYASTNIHLSERWSVSRAEQSAGRTAERPERRGRTAAPWTPAACPEDARGALAASQSRRLHSPTTCHSELRHMELPAAPTLCHVGRVLPFTAPTSVTGQKHRPATASRRASESLWPSLDVLQRRCSVHAAPRRARRPSVRLSDGLTAGFLCDRAAAPCRYCTRIVERGTL